MIPKIIHYCWFGGKPEPEDVRRCIASWKKYLPDYEIRRWDETNYDVTKNQYMNDAYKEKKWAFVSDYCRLDVVHEYGGIYLDTDVEVVRSFDDLLKERMFCGFEIRDPKGQKKGENVELSVNLGLGYGAEQEHPILKEMLDLYDSLSFYNLDGTLNLVACPRYHTQILCKHGLEANNTTQRFDGGIAYSPEFFCPQSNITEEMLCLTANTYSIHHFSRTWSQYGGQLRLRSYLIKYTGFVLADIISRILFLPKNLIYKIRK